MSTTAPKAASGWAGMWVLLSAGATAAERRLTEKKRVCSPLPFAPLAAAERRAGGAGELLLLLIV